MKYKKVPNIITSKDLDYLKDIFNWNFIAYKDVCNAVNNVKDTSIKNHLLGAKNMFFNNMKEILQHLKEASNEN